MLLAPFAREPATAVSAAAFTGSSLDLIGRARKQLSRLDALLIEAQRIDGAVICSNREQKVCAALSEAAAKANELVTQLQQAVDALPVGG